MAAGESRALENFLGWVSESMIDPSMMISGANRSNMSSEFGVSTAAAGNEDDLTALEKFGNKFYNGVCGVLCVFRAHFFVHAFADLFSCWCTFLCPL